MQWDEAEQRQPRTAMDAGCSRAWASAAALGQTTRFSRDLDRSARVLAARHHVQGVGSGRRDATSRHRDPIKAFSDDFV